MTIADVGGMPLAVLVASASPHETGWSKPLWRCVHAEARPVRLIGDRAYDSDPLDKALAQQGIEMIAPHRRNRKRKKTQDGRKLRRL